MPKMAISAAIAEAEAALKADDRTPSMPQPG